MEVKMKCTQCGCTDLEEVDFPYQAKLIMTACGLAGESNDYDLDEESSATTYICTNCGHFEFFNQDLANKILKKRTKKLEILSEINKLDNDISKNKEKIEDLANQIEDISNQLQNLDITIRKQNELKIILEELAKKLNALKALDHSLQKEKKYLQNQFKRIV